MKTERVEAITKAIAALLAQLEDCSQSEREAIGESIGANFQTCYRERTSLPHYGTTPGDGSQGTPPTSPLDAPHGFELLQTYLAAAAGHTWATGKAKRD